MSAQTPSHSVNAWLTTDELPGNITCCRVWFPENYYDALLGAIGLLADEENWEEIGTTTAEECATAFLQAYVETLRGGGCVHIGEVFSFAGSTPPDDSLLCDGASYLRADYPLLFDAIGTLWGSADGDHFNVPDLIGKFPLLVSGGNVASTGGESEHTLSVGEIPAHSHTIAQWFAPAQAGAGYLGFIASGTSFFATNNTGGGGAHNNMPPYAGLLPCIRAG
jgi:microcystin-dependent protein